MNALDDGDETALCRACKKGNVTVVQTLIRYGAQINFNDYIHAGKKLNDFSQ